MKNIVVVMTGGTIAMRIDPNLRAAIPSLSSEELIGEVKAHIKDTQIREKELFNIPSGHITPERMTEIRQAVVEALSDPENVGVIVTHGTDTLEETAYYLDISIDNEKPIVMTGAMRNASELGYDGELNLTASIATILNEESRGLGTLVVMNNEVHSAAQVTKTNTLSVNTFKSPELGPLGIIDNDEVLYYRREKSVKKVIVDTLEPKIALIKMAAGVEGDIIDFYIDNGYKGIVIEALGRGNVPPATLPSINRALELNIPIVLVSRCSTGRVLGSYGYLGGGKGLFESGVINGGYLPGHKARIALMALVSANKSKEEMEQFFKI